MSKIVLPGILSLVLVGCGNQPDRGGVLKAVKQGTLKKSATAAPLPTPGELKRTIAEALSNTDKRLAIAVVENRNSFTFLTEISQNGAFSTWGSPDRRTVTENNGIITGTRGLGGDLMSANVEGSLALVQRRKTGTTTRSHIYLDGENREQAAVFSCLIKAGGTQNIAIGEIKSSVRTMQEQCEGDGLNFENTYQVSPSGRIVQSRQWLGPANGFLTVQKLR